MPNNTVVTVKLDNGTVVCRLGIASGLVLSGVWQAYAIFFVLNILFNVILGMLWLCICL